MANKFYLILFIIQCVNYLFPETISSQNKFSVKIVQPDPIQAPVISFATVSSENKNHLMWEQKASENISYFKIYRNANESDGDWINIGTVPYPGNNSFIDPSSYPQVRPYKYRISTIDKCGKEIFTIQNHKTIKLTVDQSNDDTNVLKWNLYEGFEVEEYKIYKGSDASSLLPINTTSSYITYYTDFENTSNNTFYQVEAIGKGQYQSLTKLSLFNNKANSNIASSASAIYSNDNAENTKIHVYPNPLITSAIIVFPYEADQNFQLYILDLTGKLIYTKPIFNSEIEIERNNLKEGLYIIQIVGKKIYSKKLKVGRM